MGALADFVLFALVGGGLALFEMVSSSVLLGLFICPNFAVSTLTMTLKPLFLKQHGFDVCGEGSGTPLFLSARGRGPRCFCLREVGDPAISACEEPGTRLFLPARGDPAISAYGGSETPLLLPARGR